MGALTSFVLLLAIAAVTLSMKVDHWGTSEERAAIISEAVSEAKLSETLREQAVQASMNENKPISASMKLARGFKKASPRVQKIGKARIFMEDAVKRAERKLFEMKKTKDAQLMSSEARAEEIATELFHRPGRFLTKDELAKIYLESGCIEERSPENINCFTPPRLRFRTIDGTCNNLENATVGASETDFRRLAPPEYEDGVSSLDGTVQFLSILGQEEGLSQIMRVSPFQPPHPSPRLVSVQLIRDRIVDELPITHILMQWGQFLDHDLDLGPELEAECEGCLLSEMCQNFPVPENDYTFGLGTVRNGECLPFRRSVATCMTERPGSFEPREQINVLTSFIDGSMVYGSTMETERVVRLFENGLLRTDPPLNPQRGATIPTIESLERQGVPNVREVVACPTASGIDCFVCGDIRCNEQISLSIMHTIWVREHNRLAAELQRINPQWSDERLYQEARAIVGAEIQKITYIDYLPIVLGQEVFNQVIGPFIRYNDEVDPSVPNSFATAAYRYGHSLVRPAFDRLDVLYNPLPIGPLPLNEAFFNPAALEASQGTDPILRGLVSSNARLVDEFLSSPLTNQLFEDPNIPGSGMDLASLNIQRARDHGLPSYTTFKRFCQTAFPGLEFTDIENQLTFVRLLQVYGSLETAELWVGGLAEERLNGSLLGPTFACLFGLTFRNVRDGDRFYFESPSSTFSVSQISQIRQTSLSSVLCNNGDNIQTIQSNAFISNQPRLPCGSIPEISLGAWRENACYARLDPTNTGSFVVAFSSLLGETVILETFTNQDNRECLPFVCPNSIENSLLAVLVSNANLSQCMVDSNPGLPPTDLEPFYVGSIPLTAVTPQNGLYTSLTSCRSARTPALSFRNCLSPPSAQAEEECNVEGPDCELPLTPEMRKALDKYKGLKYATTFSKEDAVKESANIENTYASQENLLHELENELEQLVH